MIDLKTKQAFWAEQLPFFKEKYWLPNHLEVLEFDMIGGCFEIAEGVKTELSEEDILEIYHRVNSGWAMWKKAVTFMQAKAQVVPEGYVLLPKTPSHEMWSGIARHLGRYMQMHDRYCPKTLKKYFDRFIGDIPEWLNKEVKDWDSDHAFATADLPAFIYVNA